MIEKLKVLFGVGCISGIIPVLLAILIEILVDKYL